MNGAVPALFQQMFAPAFTGFALAAIAIGALVPASVMAIAAANLFSRNILRELRPSTTPEAEANASKLVSLIVKFGAVAFILAAPATSVVNFQLAGGVWILQTLPAVFLGLFVRRLDGRARSVPAIGTAWGTAMLIQAHFKTPDPHVSRDARLHRPRRAGGEPRRRAPRHRVSDNAPLPADEETTQPET